jgi:hypothetical protein
MAVLAKEFEFNCNTATALQTIASGLGFVPKGYILISFQSTTNATFQNHNNVCIGISDGTTSACVGLGSEDGVASSDAGKYHINSVLQFASQTVPDGTVDALAAHTAFGDGTIQITWSNFPAAAYRVWGIAFGGDDFSCEVKQFVTGRSTPGDQSYTTTMSTPQCGFFLPTTSATTPSQISAHGELNFGIALSATKRACMSIVAEDARATMDTWRLLDDTKCLTTLDPSSGGIDAVADFKTWDANGFTLTYTDQPSSASAVFYAMVMKGGAYDMGVISKRTSAGDTVVNPASVGNVLGVLLFSHGTTKSTSVVSHCRASFGVGSSSTDKGGGWTGDTDNVADAVTAKRGEDSNILIMATENATMTSSTVNALANLSATGSNTFTLSYSTADATTADIVWWVIGEGIALTPVEKTVTLKFDIVQQAISTNTLKFDVRSEMIKTNTLKFDIRNIIEKTNTLKFDIRTQVTKTNTLLFDIIQQVTKTNSLLFSILQQAEYTKTLKFDIRTPFEKTNTLKFDIRQLVEDTNTLKFDIIQSIVKTNTLLFDIRTPFEKTSTLKFDIRQQTEKTNTLKFDIVQQVVKQLNILFSIDQQVTKQLSILFDVRNSFVKTNTLKFDIRTEIEKLQTLRFDIRQQVEKDTSLLFDVISQVTKTTSLKFDIRQMVEKTNTLLFDILQQITPKIVTLMFDIRDIVEKDTTLRFDIVQQTIKELSIKFDILQQVTKTNTILFDIEAVGMVIKSLNLKFDILERREYTKTLKFDIRNDIEKLVSLHFDILQQAAKTVNVKFDILQPVTKTTNIKFDIRNEIEKLQTLKFDIRQEAVNLTRLKFDIWERIEKTTALKFDIRNQIDRALTILFSINQLVEKDTALKFDIIGRITKLQTLRFDIEDAADIVDLIDDILEITSEFYAAIETTRVLGRSQDETPI